MTIKTSLLAATAFVAMTGAASAITVFDGGSIASGDMGIGNGFAEAGEAITFTYTATTDLVVEDFVSFSSVGFSGGDDLMLVTYGLTGASTFNANYGSGDLSFNGTTTEADAAVSGFTMSAGESFTLFFDYAASGINATSHQYSFTTTEVAPVPVPAAGLMLLTALGGAAAMRRRK